MSHRSLLPLALIALSACGGSEQPLGKIEGPGRETASIAAHDKRLQADAEALAHKEKSSPPNQQILFGDLHVHTTYSIDAFALELPIMGGQGVHTPPDACDFARYCSGLDFFSFNDHAEYMTPEHWQATKDTVAQCNALAEDPANPDLVVFNGFEWTNVGITPQDHWGHRNVIFPGLEDSELPRRAISSRYRGSTVGNQDSTGQLVKVGFVDPINWTRYQDLGWLLERAEQIGDCPKDVPTSQLPLDCNEVAEDPAQLFLKLDELGQDHLVIPHGNTWGLYTPVNASWDKTLNRKQHDPDNERLLEIMSGHGNSEQYRSWRHMAFDENGKAYCPEPSGDFLPCCWQAGEIMRSRCDGLSESECETRILQAREFALHAGPYPNGVFPDAQAEEWLNCGQCSDCFKPSYSMRPKESSQYAMAISNFDEPEVDGRPMRFKWGFIASTDDHTARPGTGYKQYERRKMTFASGARSKFYLGLMSGKMDDPQQPLQVDIDDGRPDSERAASFSYPGGIVAVHSDGRDRQAIWDALKRKEVYGTSGPRIMLWFDLLNGGGKKLPMGSEVELGESPLFAVRALGDFVQQAGCPAPNRQALNPERMTYLCANECYHPGDKRHPITAIEVVRIRPQQKRNEAVDSLIEDPWLVLSCPAEGSGCAVTFEDPDFDRDTLYYVRALQEATPAINGEYLREKRNAQGEVESVEPCYGSYRTAFSDDCLAPLQERAWSSPIFVNYRLQER